MRRLLCIGLAGLAAIITLVLVAAPRAQFLNAAHLAVSVRAGETVFDNSGNPWPFFTELRAINYDTGGSGVAYVASPHVNCTTNGSSYRNDYINFNVDTVFPFRIGCFLASYSFRYTINIPASPAGPYVVNLTMANGGSSSATMTISVDNTPVATAVIPPTGSYSTFTTVASGQFNAAVGNHILTMACTTGNSDNACGDMRSFQGAQVGAGGGPVACDTGPSGAPFIPQAAQAGGFTTCALYLDFTQGTFTGNPANYMSNCGATIPHPFRMYFLDDLNSGNFNGDANCNRTTVVTSPRGVRTLLFSNTPDDHNNGGHSLTSFKWEANGVGGADILPLWGYTEITFELTGRSQVGSTFGNPVILAWWHQNSGNFANEIEFDDIEIFKEGYSVSNGGNHQYMINCGLDVPVCSDGVDWTQTHRYGVMLTSDGGGNAAQCVYLDGVLKICFTGPSGSQHNDNKLFFWIGNCSGGLCITENINVYFHKVQQWECANWQTQQCFSSVVTNPPNPTN